LVGHTDYVASIAYSPDGKTLATGSADNTVRLWDIQKGTTKRIIREYSTCVKALAYSHDGKLLLAASDGDEITKLSEGKASSSYLPAMIDEKEPKLWISDPLTGDILRRVRAKSAIMDVAFAENDKMFATVGISIVQCWDTQTFKELYSIATKGGIVYSIVVFSGGKKIAIGTENGSIEIWDLPPGTTPSITIKHGSLISRLALSPDGLLLASAGQDGKTLLWDSRTGKLRATFTSDGLVTSVAFSPDGKLLASSNQIPPFIGPLAGKATLWDVRTGKKIAELNTHAGGVTALAFAPDGKSMATSDKIGKVRIWVLPADLLEK
jgi:WD40 repeat protein